MAAHGVDVSIVYLNEGNRSVVHPSSQKLMEQGCVLHIGRPNRWQMAKALGALLMRQPWRTVGTLVKALRSPQRWLYFSVLPAAIWCLSRQVDFLHAHFADVNLQAAQALSQWLGLPFGVTTHRYDILDDPIDPMIASELFRASILAVTISQWNVNHMIRKYPLRRDQVHIVHCGVDLTAFAFQERTVIDGGPLRLLNVGRLVPVKGQAALLRAMAQIKAQGIACNLEVIGAGPLEECLRQQISELGLADRVELLGARSQDFVRHALQRADAFVLSSTVEGLPVACIEAAAIGTPIIATRINGLPELIDDGVSGLLVEADDAFALAQAIAWAAAHREAMSSMAVVARSKVEAEFDRAACTQKLLALMGTASQVRA